VSGRLRGSQTSVKQVPRRKRKIFFALCKRPILRDFRHDIPLKQGTARDGPFPFPRTRRRICHLPSAGPG